MSVAILSSDLSCPGNEIAARVSGDLGYECDTWDDGCGACGREGQWVPVAVGQPTVLIAPGVLRVA